MTDQIKIVRQEGNVIITDDSDIILASFPFASQVSVSKTDPNMITIGNNPEANDNNGYDFDWRDVLIPLEASRSELVDKLVNEFFFEVQLPATGKDSNNSTSTIPTVSTPYSGVGSNVTTYSLITVSIMYESTLAHTGTLFLEFSPDNTNWVAIDNGILVTVPATVSLSRFAPRTLTIINSFFRVRYVPDDNNLTTFFLETIFSVDKNAKLTSRLDGDLVGNEDVELTKSAITGQDDAGVFRNVRVTPSRNIGATLLDSQTGSRQIVDLNGAAKFGEAVILVGDKFGTFVPNPLQWTTDFVGSGASLSLPGTQRIETGTTANSEARFQSVKAARFMISQFNIFHGGIEIDNISDTNCERRFGAFDPINPSQNGAYFALIDGVWNVGYSKAGVETLIPQSSWNGTNKDLFNANPALSVYEIQYNAGAIFFFQGPNFVHRVAGLASPYAALYDFRVGCEVINKNGNTTNNGINFRALGTYRLGEERGETIARAFVADTLIKTGAGYISSASLSRTGSGGGAASVLIYDGVDNTGILMGRIDIGGDDLKGINLNSTFSDGLFIDVNGNGTVTATITYE